MSLAAFGCSTVGESPVAYQVDSDPVVRAPLYLHLDDQAGIWYAGIHLADRLGYYIDRGFQSVTLLGPEDGLDVTGAVLAQTALIGYADFVDLVPLISTGVPVRVVAAHHPHSALAIARVDGKKIESLSDLEGDALGLPASSTASWLSVLEAIGVGRNPRISSISDESVVLSLVDGSVAGVIVDRIRWRSRFEAIGIPIDYTPLRALTTVPPGRVVFTSAATVETDTDGLVAAVGSELVGWNLALSDPAAAVDVTVNHFAADRNLSDQAVAAELQVLIDVMTNGTGSPAEFLRLETERIDEFTALFASAGTTIPPETFVTAVMDQVG